uniref:Uncharacterized protein n=1 Tax=Panagrolaimus sp. PS1159 TaxID=55785 RepID=A0AC35GFI7_9BILA
MTKTERQFVKVEKGEKVEIIAIEPFQHNSPEYKCCCNAIHFKMGAAIIGILTIIAALITITLSAIWNYWWPIIPAIIFLGLAILILYAHKSEKQNFYLPYSIVTGILILTAFLFVILSIVLIIFIPSWSQDFVQNVRSRQFDDEQQKHDATRVFYTWLIIALLIFILIGAWFVWVVYKAFMYMRDMHLARHPYKFLYTNGIKDGLEHTQNSGMSGRQHHATNGNVEKY